MNKPVTHFTPGPWILKEWADIAAILASDDETLIDDFKELPKLEYWANAKLMATAPEMFSVLVEVAEFLEELAASSEDYPLTLAVARAKVEQVIEKANYKD